MKVKLFDDVEELNKYLADKSSFTTHIIYQSVFIKEMMVGNEIQRIYAHQFCVIEDND